MEKNKTRFNFVDALIVLIILAVIGLGVYVLVNNTGSAAQANTEAVQFVVRLSGVKENAIPFIEIGETAKNSATGEVLGKIVSVRTEKTPVYGDIAIIGDDGMPTVAIGEYEGLYDLYVVIEAQAKQDDRGIYTVGNARILVGSTIYFKVPSFASVSYITNILTR